MRIFTILGSHKDGVITSNAGEFRPKNWRSYANLEGYWELQFINDRLYIKRFTPKE